MIDTKSIRRQFIGGEEFISFADFATNVVQDEGVALEVAHRMLKGEDPYEWNPDQPEFYEQFSVVDAEALEFQTEKED